MTAMPFVMKRPAQKKRYQNMQDRDLVACNTKARIMKRRFHFTAYLGAVPIFLLTSVLPKLGFSLCVFGLFIMFGFLVMSRFFKAIEDVTTSEMDFRKFKRDTETPNQAMHQQPGAGK